MSSEVETSRGEPIGNATGFLDFARNDGKMRAECFVHADTIDILAPARARNRARFTSARAANISASNIDIAKQNCSRA